MTAHDRQSTNGGRSSHPFTSLRTARLDDGGYGLSSVRPEAEPSPRPRLADGRRQARGIEQLGRMARRVQRLLLVAAQDVERVDGASRRARLAQQRHGRAGIEPVAPETNRWRRKRTVAPERNRSRLSAKRSPPESIGAMSAFARRMSGFAGNRRNRTGNRRIPYGRAQTRSPRAGIEPVAPESIGRCTARFAHGRKRIGDRRNRSGRCQG